MCSARGWIAGIVLTGAVVTLPLRAHAMPRLHILDVPAASLPAGPFRLTDVKLDLGGPGAGAPLAPDQGGGDGEARGAQPVLAFILGFIPGFGLGHLVAGSFGGFIGFLITDVVLLAVLVVLTAITPSIFYVVGWIVWVAEHVYEGIDAARSVSSPSVAERASSRLMVAGGADCLVRAPRAELMPALRTLSLDF